MKIYSILILTLPLLSMQTANLREEPNTNFEQIKTGIELDTLQNEVYLALQNGSPKFYFSNIFTPVCNTGQCLPVYINLYWNLTGRFVRFDFPEGEILTKLEHVPFSPEDYILLNEILKGPDPRLNIPILESHVSQGAKHNQDNQAKPAPNASQSAKKLSKYDMVDGITGATAIQHNAKFVPGALYTTYTLWGLANDSGIKMFNYSRENLFIAKNICALLTDIALGCQAAIIDHYAPAYESPEARANFLMSIVDTANSQTAIAAINWVYFNEFFLDTVVNTLNRKFYGASSEQLKTRILQTWAYNFANDATLLTLSERIGDYNLIFKNILLVFENKAVWPAGTLANLTNQFKNLSQENQRLLYGMLLEKKNWFEKDDQVRIDELKKKYNL